MDHPQYPTDVNQVADLSPELALGVGPTGPVTWNPDIHQHLVIAGPLRSGKTTATRVLAASAQAQGSRIYAIGSDPGLSTPPFLDVGQTLESAEQLVRDIRQTVEERASVTGSGAVDDPALPVFLVVDHPERLTPTGDAWESQEEHRNFLTYAVLAFALTDDVHLVVVDDAGDAEIPGAALLQLADTGIGELNGEPIAVFAAPNCG